MQKHAITISDGFDFECGKRLECIDIVFHTSPRPYRKDDKVVWVCHALTANSDPEDWWPQMVGPGKTIDTDKYFVVCANIFGSPYGTSGPSTIDPQTGRPYFLTFPEVSIRDIVNANILVRKHLGLGKIDFLVGASVGGFQAVEWSVMEPDVIRKAVFLATEARVCPLVTAYSESQRMALEADSTFREARDLKGGELGLRCARSIAIISYRCYEGYKKTQSEPDEDCFFATRASSYQRHQGKKLSDRFDAYSYWYLCDSMDRHNVGRGRGGVARALSTIKAETVVIAIDTDSLFTVDTMKEMAGQIPGARFYEIHSLYGHDGFLLEYGQLISILKPMLP